MHDSNGHGPNGHGPNGHGPNGHGPNGSVQEAPSANGFAVNGHATIDLRDDASRQVSVPYPGVGRDFIRVENTENEDQEKDEK